jgi:hypothetical protein
MLSVTASICLATAAVHKRCRLLSSHSLDPRRGIVVGRTARNEHAPTQAARTDDRRCERLDNPASANLGRTP